MIFRSEQTEDLVNSFTGIPPWGQPSLRRYPDQFLSEQRAVPGDSGSGVQRYSAYQYFPDGLHFGGTGAPCSPTWPAVSGTVFARGGANLDKISIGGALLMPYFRFPNQQEGGTAAYQLHHL